MKGIKKTLIAGVLACATFNAHAEVDPFSYGISGYVGTSSVIGYGDQVKIDNKKAHSALFDAFVGGGSLYGEYAFVDWFGVEVKAGYARQGATLIGEEDQQGGGTSNKSISMTSHGITTGLNVKFYPLGREEEEGIAKVTLGSSFYFPLQHTYKSGDTQIVLTGDQEKERPAFNIAVTGGVGYEFPIGLFIEAKYSYGLTNAFKTEGDVPQTIFTSSTASTSGLKNCHQQSIKLEAGVNLVPLLS